MPDIFDIYIGTYTTESPSKGIYRATLDASSGILSEPELVCEIRKPSFLAIHPNGRFIYSVTEGEPGLITALEIDKDNHRLNLINRASAGGSGPCHVNVSDCGKNLLVANYVSGTVASLPVNSDGSLDEPVSVIQHCGSGPDKERQAGPHVHSVNLSPDNRFAYVADLGIDKVMIYSMNPDTGELSAENAQLFEGRPGSGPRHLTFHQNGRFVYLINELDNTVTALSYTPETGSLSEIQTISTLPEGCLKESKTAEVKVHPNGRFLYGSNRGDDSIVIYEIDRDLGRLTLIGFQHENIDEPRHFNIDPTGKYCIVGNQDTNSITLFDVDPQSGVLTPTGIEQSVGKPICIKLVIRES